jgi:malonyl-CoA/methylmalonyl-CoA synthetase
VNTYAYFAQHFRRTPSRIFLEADSGENFCYADLERETARYSNFLTALGLQRGDRVAVQVEKSPQAVFVYLACLRTGLCYLPLNNAYQQGEIRYFLNDAQPAVAICSPQNYDWYSSLCNEAKVPNLFTLDQTGAGTFPQAAASSPTEFVTVPSHPDDLAVIIYTSGTTGRSKGAMVTHGNLTSNAQVLCEAWRITPQDTLIHALPIFHIHGLFVALNTILLSAAKLIFHRKFDARTVLADLPAATLLMGVPTFYTRLLAEASFTRDSCRSMRLFISGSAPLLLDTFNEFRERTGHTILERYGMSEAGMICSNPYAGERRGGSVGLPLPGVSLRIAGGGTGVIEIKGANVFSGYWRMPEKTKQEFTDDGYFKTGDIGIIDRDGYVFIVGRAKDLIISGGFNVYPKEIELLIDEIPGVAESAVIGLPHPDFGEAVTAVIVRNQDNAALSEADVIANLKNQLANFKMPKRVHFVDELPRNTMGKVQKNVLRTRFSNAENK